MKIETVKKGIETEGEKKRHFKGVRHYNGVINVETDGRKFCRCEIIELLLFLLDNIFI